VLPLQRARNAPVPMAHGTERPARSAAVELAECATNIVNVSADGVWAEQSASDQWLESGTKKDAALISLK